MTRGWWKSAKTNFSIGYTDATGKIQDRKKLRGLTEVIRHLYLDKNKYFCLFVFFLAMLNFLGMGP